MYLLSMAASIIFPTLSSAAVYLHTSVQRFAQSHRRQDHVIATRWINHLFWSVASSMALLEIHSTINRIGTTRRIPVVDVRTFAQPHYSTCTAAPVLSSLPHPRLSATSMPADRRRSPFPQTRDSGRQTMVNHIHGAIREFLAVSLVTHSFSREAEEALVGMATQMVKVELGAMAWART